MVMAMHSQGPHVDFVQFVSRNFQNCHWYLHVREKLHSSTVTNTGLDQVLNTTVTKTYIP